MELALVTHAHMLLLATSCQHIRDALAGFNRCSFCGFENFKRHEFCNLCGSQLLVQHKTKKNHDDSAVELPGELLSSVTQREKRARCVYVLPV